MQSLDRMEEESLKVLWRDYWTGRNWSIKAYFVMGDDDNDVLLLLSV